MTRYLALWKQLLVVSWRRQRALTVGLFAVEIGGFVAAVGLAVAMGQIIDAASAGSRRAAVIAALALAAVSVVNVVVRGLGPSLIFRAVSQVSDTGVDPKLVSDIASLESIEHLERSDVLARIAVLRHASWGVVASLWSAVQAAFVLVRSAAVLLLLGLVSPWLMVLMPVACVPLWCDRRGRALISRAETDNAEAFALQRHLFELATSASAGKELRVTGAAEELARRQAAAWDSVVAGQFRARVRAFGWRVVGWSFFVLAFLGCLAMAIQFNRAGQSAAGGFVMAVTAAVALQQSMTIAVNQISGTLGASRVLEPYLWLRDYVAQERARGSGKLVAPDMLSKGISLRGVDFTYPHSDWPALRDITVHLPAGSVVAVVGEYGSGKTTLVKLLSKFYPPTSGRVLVDGIDLAELDTAKWRARTSAAYQDFGRYPQTTVAESIGMGDLLRLDDGPALAEATRDADAESFIERLPLGMQTKLGVSYGGIEVSEGQWQKLALARASMRQEPLMFVLDEPTASLDAPSEHQIVERYVGRARELARRTGAVTIVVTHRFSTVSSADLILVLDKGRLIEHGSHLELLEAGGQYRRLYLMQAKAYQQDAAR